MFDLIITVNTGTVLTSTNDGHKDENAKLRAELLRVKRENDALRLYTEWIQNALDVLPATVTDWVAGIKKMSPLNRSDEPPVEDE